MSKKEIIGKCHICGVVKKLSYEHVPPEKAYNDKAVKVYLALDIVKGGDLPWNVDNIRGEILQRGTGAYTLCIDCNSQTGARYVKDFIDVSTQSSDPKNIGVSKNYAFAEVNISDVSPLNFAKQVLAMLASVNGDSFFEKQTELRDLVMNYESYGIDKKKYALFMYFYRGGMGRSSGLSVSMRTDGVSVLSTEFVTTPFGFVLILDPDRGILPEYGAEITDLFDYQPIDRADIKLTVPVFEQNSPMPLDFRTRQDIKDQMSST